MRTLATTLVAAGALGFASLASTAPAQAQYYHRCWNCGGGDVAAGVVGGTILGLGLGSALAAPPPVAYACHYERMRDYDAYGYPIIVRRRVCD